MTIENPLDAGNEDTTSTETTETTIETTETTESTNGLYGDMKVEWPEGTEEYLRSEPSLKPFVDKEGKINQSALLKSYHETKKSYGADRVIMPNENSTPEELQEFWNKAGAATELESYKQELGEGAVLKPEFMESMEKFAHENKMPVGLVGKLTNFIDEQAKLNDSTLTEQHQNTLREGIETVKTEYGEAYDSKISLAKQVLDTFTEGDEREMFNNPSIGANPAVLKTLVRIGEKLFSEGSFKGNERSDGAVTPSEAQESINAIMGDANHPYHKPQHPSHGDATAKMLKLFSMRG